MSENKVIFTVTEGTPLHLALEGVVVQANKYFGKSFPVEYWAEQALSKGLRAQLNYIRSDQERRDKESFCQEMSKMTPPTDANNVQAMANYAIQVGKLRVKYHQGGTAVQV